jgi:hypothetical protein
MAFDIGAGSEAWGTEGLIEQDGKRWMPVEITVPDDGFYQAWRIGAREWRNAASGGLTGEEGRLYPMGESWTLYPPVTAPGAGDTLPPMPPREELVRRFRETLLKIRK